MNGDAPLFTWLVTEDVAGVLTLYVFERDGDVVVFARDHYERTPGLLRHDVGCLRRGEGPAALGEGLPDGQARWNGLGENGADRGGYWVIADHDEIIPAECMCTAAWVELRP